MKRRLPAHAGSIGLVVGLLLLVVIGWFALIAPQRSKASSLKAQIDGAELQIQSYQLRPRTAATHAAPVSVSDVFRLSAALPDSVSMPDILLELNRIAGESGIKFSSITPHAPSMLTGYEVVPIDVIFNGNYYALSDLLYRLRNLVEVHDGHLQTTGRLFTVDRISFGQGQHAFPQIEAALTINAFVYSGTPVLTAGQPATAEETSSTTSTTVSSTTTTTPAPPSGASATGATP